jgi:hypothetical protein
MLLTKTLKHALLPDTGEHFRPLKLPQEEGEREEEAME